MFMRNRFLNTASFLSGPKDKPGEGSGAADDDQNVGGDDTGAEGGAEAGDDTGAEGGEEGAEGAEDEAGGDDGDADADGDDDADDEEDETFAGLTPEQRKKVEARIAKETRWRDRQIDKLHARTRSAKEDVTAAETIVSRAAKPGENLTADQIEERAKTLATQMSAQEKYDNDANAAHAAGVKAYGDKWGRALAKLPKLGGVDINDMVDVLAADHPEVVLFSLSDPDTYEEVMSLPPAKRRTAIIKLGIKEPPKPKGTAESKRPGDVTPPVRQVPGGRKVAAQTVNLHDDKVADDAWYAARNATRRKKFSNVS